MNNGSIVRELNTINYICDSDNLNKHVFLKSNVDPSEQLPGPPYERIEFLCKEVRGTVNIQIACESDHVIGLQVLFNYNVVLILIVVYRPYDNSSVDQTNVDLDILDYIQDIMDITGSCVPTIIM